MHNNTFWGKPDATINFCEDKYDKSYFIAEYYNTISAVFYMIIGLLTFFFTRLKFLGKILFFIGIGTMLLHATLRHWAQMCDEISLLVLSFYTLKELKSSISGYIIYPILIGYVIFSKFFFMFFFIFTTIQVLIAKNIKKLINDKNKIWINLYVISFIIGIICWGIDQLCNVAFSDSLKKFQFHAWWHLFTALAGGFGVLVLNRLN